MRAITIAFLVMSCLFSVAQELRTSITLNNAPLILLVEEVEKSTSYRFYFKRSWIDTVHINVDANNASLNAILQQALKNTGLNYFIDGSKVILTPSPLTDQINPAVSSTTIFSRAVKPDFEEEANAQRKETIREVGIRGKGAKNSATITGHVREKKSGEPLPGAVIQIKGTNIASVTDAFGTYTIRVSPGAHTVTVNFVSMNSITQRVIVHGDGKLDFSMQESVSQLKEVVVEAEVDANITNVQMGTARIDIRSMKNIPKILGENDVLKVAASLPGVKTVGEGASGINVRGGHADQNLVLLNEATIYNTSHFLGFFSVFNPAALRSFELYKSGMPVQYGGRLSSTFELLMRDGNKQKFSGQGGLGPITSHLTLEAPIIKDKTSIMAGARTTYSNWVLRAIKESSIKDTRASFHDYFARISHTPNDKNALYLSLYASNDEFNLSSDTLFAYSNKLASLQWRHVFNANTDALFSITRSEYDYRIHYDTRATEAFSLGFDVRESNAKAEVNHVRGKHRFTYGVQARLYELNPGFVNKENDSSTVRPRQVEREKAIESAVFVSDNFEITPELSVYYGLRYSGFAALGPRQIREYYPGQPRSEQNISGSVNYANNDIVKTYHGPEYRFSFRYKLNERTAFKGSYNRTRQYIHMLSNTVSVSPTDTWKLSDTNIHPQVADQVSVGYYSDLKREVYEFSLEVYRKWIDNILDYKTGAVLLANESIEQEILQGQGKAYGVEVLLRKKSGKLTGWLGYSYSRTLIRMAGESPSEVINDGKYFPANYDKPHDISMITNYKITRRYSLSLNFAYSTGRPITYPTSAYRFGNTFRVNYSDRNAYRIPDYVRLDVGFDIEGNHKIKKLAHSFWTISIYNVLGRRNPYSIYFRVDDGEIKGYRLSIFGAPIPTITYHFRF